MKWTAGLGANSFSARKELIVFINPSVLLVAERARNKDNKIGCLDQCEILKDMF